MDGGGRPVFNALERPVGQFCLLEPSTGRISSRRHDPELANVQGLRFPSFFSDRKLSREIEEGGGRGSPRQSVLAEPALVSRSSSDGHGHAIDAAQPAEPSNVGEGGATPFVQPPVIPVDRLEVVRKRLEERSLPKEVVDLLLAGIRSTTISAYQSAWVA